MSRKASLIVLAWNRWDLTARCLKTLRRTDLTDAEVIVVDNGSTDETPTKLASFDWLRVVRLPKNVGFVRGNNAGIEAAAAGSDVVLLNNDVEFYQGDWLQALRRCAHMSPQTGVAGCRLVLPNGRLLHAGTYILSDTMWGQQIGSLEEDIGQYTKTREVEGIVFACAYLKREVLDSIGGLSLDYESYFEDTDYCLRARAAGFKTLLCGEVTLVHNEHGSTDGNARRFKTLFEKSRKAFKARWKRDLEKGYRDDLLWQSIMNFPSGYARATREFLPALERCGVRTAYRYVYGAGSPFPVEEPKHSGDYMLDVLHGRSPGRHPSFAVVFGQGDAFRRNAGKYRIGYTMLEVDGFPAEWVRQANALDEVWVPTEFNREGFLDCGLRRPLKVMPLGINTDYFHPGIQGHQNSLGEFVFLASFEWGERKEPWMLLRTFNQTFRAKEPVRLLCKIINRDPGVSVKSEIMSLCLDEDGGKMSFLYNLEFPHYQLGSFYRSGDCFVGSSRGEGWDMPLMEAMACGLPTIATDWGAHRDFVHEDISYPLRVRGTVRAVAKCPYYEGFSWAEPDAEHLSFLLRWIYEHRDEARAKGAAAAREMATRWSWDAAAAKIAARLRELGG